ncbi:hypothetical protein LOZ66_001308 [Ophidiomyces ophidiicola]|nr:hypothetical protein LOZ66_001308 [Ophidiomyces ophidiicola]
MKQCYSYLTICLAAATTAVASKDASIYMLNNAPASDSRTEWRTSPDAAKLVLTRRLGWLGASTIGDVEQKILRDVNDIGGQQTILFGDSDRKELRHKLLTIVQGFAPSKKIYEQKDQLRHVKVASAAPNFMETAYINSLFTETAPQSPVAQLCSYRSQQDSNTIFDLSFQIKDGLECPPEELVLEDLTNTLLTKDGGHRGLDSMIRSYVGASPIAPGSHVSAFLRVVNTMAGSKRLATTDKLAAQILDLVHSTAIDTTVVVLPGQNWETPSPIRSSRSTSPSDKRRSVPQLTPIIHRAASNSSKHNNTLSTLLPLCYASNETCNTRTNSCSGHGYCYLKRSGSNKGNSCYACKCLRTVDHTNTNGGNKTTLWGGPACQKKDVSMPFWLLTGFTVLLVVGISLAIVMMWNMGQEELPGVLSAGVSGSKAQK